MQESLTKGMEQDQSDTNSEDRPADTREGPVVETVKNETAKTGEELRGLQNSKTIPEETASTGQALTRKSRQPPISTLGALLTTN